MKSVSVIVPAYNEEKYLGKYLSSLKKQNSKFELIVVNNNSTDKTAKIVKKYANKVLKCKKQGIASARNYGAKNSSGDILCFIDSDGIVDKKWVARVKKHFSRDKNLSAISGFIIFDTKNPFKFFIYNLYNVFVFSVLYIGNKIGKYYVAGNNMAIKKDLFLKVGGFPNYVFEDIKLSYILRENKPLKIKFDPKMVIRYSTRRFEKKGFIRTLLFWVKALNKNINIKEDTYKEDY